MTPINGPVSHRSSAQSKKDPIANNNNKNTHGTKLVWNSFKSTLSEPSNRNEAVIDETT
jgi:hypothetical protein